MARLAVDSDCSSQKPPALSVGSIEHHATSSEPSSAHAAVSSTGNMADCASLKAPRLILPHMSLSAPPFAAKTTTERKSTRSVNEKLKSTPSTAMPLLATAPNLPDRSPAYQLSEALRRQEYCALVTLWRGAHGSCAVLQSLGWTNVLWICHLWPTVTGSLLFRLCRRMDTMVPGLEFTENRTVAIIESLVRLACAAVRGPGAGGADSTMIQGDVSQCALPQAAPQQLAFDITTTETPICAASSASSNNDRTATW